MIYPQIHQFLLSQKKAQVIVYNGVNLSKELPIRKKYSLFSISMCDIFLIVKVVHFTGFADYSTSFAVADIIKDKLVRISSSGFQTITRSRFLIIATCF